MIGLTTQLFDLKGSLIVHNKNIKNIVNKEKSRRASSVKTLDGGSYTLDFGYSETDDRLNLEFINLSEEDVFILERMVELHSKIRVSTTDGIYLCIFKKLKKFNGSLKIDIIVAGNL